MITKRGLDAIPTLSDWRKPAGEAFDEAVADDKVKACPVVTHSVKEPPPWDDNPLNVFHFVLGDLVLPARNDSDDVAVYEHSGTYWLVGWVDGPMLVRLSK